MPSCAPGEAARPANLPATGEPRSEATPTPQRPLPRAGEQSLDAPSAARARTGASGTCGGFSAPAPRQAGRLSPEQPPYPGALTSRPGSQRRAGSGAGGGSDSGAAQRGVRRARGRRGELGRRWAAAPPAELRSPRERRAKWTIAAAGAARAKAADQRRLQAQRRLCSPRPLLPRGTRQSAPRPAGATFAAPCWSPPARLRGEPASRGSPRPGASGRPKPGPG